MTKEMLKKPTMAEVRSRQDPQFILHFDDFKNEDDLIMHATARIFGLLVETAAPIIESYHSDLYHDSVSLRSLVDNVYVYRITEQFVWSVNESGTAWSKSQDGSYDREYAFLCTIWIERERIYFKMERR